MQAIETNRGAPRQPANTANSAKKRAKNPGLSFITFTDPKEAKTRNQTRLVRSHVASYQHSMPRAAWGSRKRPNGAAQAGPSSDLAAASGSSTEDENRDVVLKPHASNVILRTTRQSNHGNQSLLPMDEFMQLLMPRTVLSVLGQGRVDPFRTYPIPYDPKIPEFVDHYLTNMAADIPELDEENQPGLLRSRWFPLVMTESAIFRVVMLLAAHHHATLPRAYIDKPNLIQLKSRALIAVNDAMKVAVNSDDATKDQMIGAVAKMASFEAMFGTQDAFEMHMKGLTKMVELRGGLRNLGLGGLLARICVWVDLNSAFLHNSERHFKDVPSEVAEKVTMGGIAAFLAQS